MVSNFNLHPYRTDRKEGRPLYEPASYQVICDDACECVLDGLKDNLTLMEVEFPAVPGEDSSYKASSEVFMDFNIQYALSICAKIRKVRRC